MEKEKNQTIEAIWEGYAADFRNLEDSYFELAGHYPAWDETDFWNANVVKEVNCLLTLWWDIKDIRANEVNNEKN